MSFATSFAPPPPIPVKIGLWRGAHARGYTGLDAVAGLAAYSVWEVPCVPDFSSARFPDLARLDKAQRIAQIAPAMAQLLGALFLLGPHYGFSLRYLHQKREGGEAQTRIFLVGRCFDTDDQQAQVGIVAFDEVVRRNFPRDYRCEPLSPDDEMWPVVARLEGAATGVELLKPESALGAWHDRALCGFSFWYFCSPFSPNEHDMVGVCHTLARSSGAARVCVDISLVPSVPFTPVEVDEMKSWTMLAEKWGREQKVKGSAGLYSQAQLYEIASDPHAADVKKSLSEALARYGNPQNRCFLYAIRAWSWNAHTPLAATAALESLSTQALQAGSNVAFFPLDASNPVFERALSAGRACSISPAVCQGTIWNHPDAPETLRRWHRLADLKELSGFFRLPIAGREGVPGVALDSGLSAQNHGQSISPKSQITLGNFIEGVRVTGDEAAFDLQDLKKHALVVGTPGSGKTTLCFSLLRQLWQEHGIPFLVLEPAKTEYRTLKELAGMREELLVFTVGNERISPWRFNPFEIMDGVPVSEHISSLNTCFAGAFNLFDPLPMILDEALRETYAERGWSEYGVGGDDPSLEPPTMADLQRHALKVAEKSSYKGEVAGNIKGALETRLGALMRGPKGRVFNTRRGVPISLLLQSPVVVELESLNDEEKALAMMFLLVAIREYANATRKSGSPLKHVVLVEEAHNIIGRGENSNGNTANPKEVAVRFFTRMLAEMRAKGQGVVIADQLPTAIAPEAIKNTNIKVMHRVVAADDREELGAAMILDAAQMEAAAIQPAGHSLVFMEGWSRARPVLEPNFKAQFGLEENQDNATLHEQMNGFEERSDVRAAFLPYDGCEKVCRTCNRQIRESNERWANAKKPIIAAKIHKEAATHTRALALGEFFNGLNAPRGSIEQGCAFVHFNQWFGKEAR